MDEAAFVDDGDKTFEFVYHNFREKKKDRYAERGKIDHNLPFKFCWPSCSEAILLLSA
jgi:hypothetical protein